jgi:hypothetical protein
MSQNPALTNAGIHLTLEVYFLHLGLRQSV